MHNSLYEFCVMFLCRSRYIALKNFGKKTFKKMISIFQSKLYVLYYKIQDCIYGKIFQTTDKTLISSKQTPITSLGNRHRTCMRWPRPPVTIPVQSLWPVGSSTGPYRISDRVEPYHSFYIVCYLRTKYTNVITCEKQYEMLSFRLRIHILLHKTWISLFIIHPPWFDK